MFFCQTTVLALVRNKEWSAVRKYGEENKLIWTFQFNAFVWSFQIDVVHAPPMETGNDLEKKTSEKKGHKWPSRDKIRMGVCQNENCLRQAAGKLMKSGRSGIKWKQKCIFLFGGSKLKKRMMFYKYFVSTNFLNGITLHLLHRFRLHSEISS